MKSSKLSDRRFKCRWQNRRGKMAILVAVIIVFSQKGLGLRAT
jgi:hypothetical protein